MAEASVVAWVGEDGWDAVELKVLAEERVAGDSRPVLQAYGQIHAERLEKLLSAVN